LQDFPMILFDEAITAFDAQSEQLVQESPERV
jgi:ABC-type multidrug transport system fused ATPase/permease subunit